MIKLNLQRAMGMTPRALNQAGNLRSLMAALASRSRVRTKRNRKCKVVIHRRLSEWVCTWQHFWDHEGRHPRNGPMALRAIVGKRGRVGVAGMHRMHVGLPIIVFVASETVGGHSRQEAIASSNVALRTVSESVHSGERKERFPMHLQGVGELKAARRVALVARLAKAPLMRIEMA